MTLPQEVLQVVTHHAQFDVNCSLYTVPNSFLVPSFHTPVPLTQ